METETPIESKANNVDLWEAWIDMQGSGNSERGTLYLIGDLIVSSRILKPTFVKRESDTNPDHELVLEIVPNIIAEDGYAVEIFYAEDLQYPNQYKSITIYYAGEVLAKINEIEVLL